MRDPVTAAQVEAMALPVVATEGDRGLAELLRRHFDDLMWRHPIAATYLGIHEHDHRLPDLSREALLDAVEAEQRQLGALESIDPADLSEPNRIELELAVLGARRAIFDAEVHRVWERRTSAADEIGDGLFLLLAREFAPLPDRLAAITARLEATPAALVAVRDRLADRPVRLWLDLELRSTESLPAFLDVIVEAGRDGMGEGLAQRRLERAADAAKAALADYARWLQGRAHEAGDGFALGADDFDRLVELRALDGLDADDILAIGEQQLDEHHEARRAAAAEIDPKRSEAEVLSQVKAHHPTTFEEALEGYQDVMRRARAFIREHDLATLPSDETLAVVPTPEYLRSVMPFAAYFQPGAFDRPRKGLYIVTPSVDGDPRAMLEHSWASISNTSIHEAYPGHHHQLTAALERPTLSRLLIEAPEFVEGWGMYSEQLMREHGFDATPEHRVILATDAIWRACRIILDVRLHRGEIGVTEAIDFLVAHTGFERPNATAEVHRYTHTPTYQLSYLLGKVLILRLREDERARWGREFSLKRFHDALLWSGSIPVSFHRRLLAGEGGGPFLPAGS
jgi:uncharacterized protein (DUF885 family)